MPLCEESQGVQTALTIELETNMMAHVWKSEIRTDGENEAGQFGEAIKSYPEP